MRKLLTCVTAAAQITTPQWIQRLHAALNAAQIFVALTANGNRLENHFELRKI